MKRCLALLIAALFIALCGAHAEGPDDQYVRIYNLIQEGDALVESSQSSQALAKYVEAHTALQKFQKGFPEWNADVIKFRLRYLTTKIGDLSAKVPSATIVTTNKPAAGKAPVVQAEKPAPPADWENQIASLKEQVKQLESDKSLLTAKLKEALAAQPATADPRELTQAEERLKMLQKENDLLKVTLGQEKSKPASKPEAKPESKNVAQLKSQLAAARARLEVLEAKAIPYSAEELALLKQTTPTLAQSETSVPAHELPPGAANLLKEAKVAFKDKQYSTAEAKYLELLKLDPKNAAALTDLAVIQLQLNRLDEAEKTVKQALELSPENAYSLSVLGHVRFQQAKYDEALDVFSRAASLDPQSYDIQNYLGVTLSQKGQRIAAENALRKAIELKPNSPEAHHNLAMIYLAQKPPAPALARWHYQKALAAGDDRAAELQKLFEKPAQP
jgi:Flp pilus assembly protein TadD